MRSLPLFLLVASCASSPPPAPPPPPPSNANPAPKVKTGCVADVGCHDEIELPACEGGTKGIYNVEQLRRLRHSFDGKQATTYGVLKGVISDCTDKACGAGNTCCNQCHGYASFDA